MLKVTVLGRIGGDATARTLNDGRIVFNFSVADNYKQKDQQTGETKEVARWFSCSYFTKSERVGEYLKKGRRVLVIGELFFREYYNNGKVGRSNDVTVETLQLIDFSDEESRQTEQVKEEQVGNPVVDYEDLHFK